MPEPRSSPAPIVPYGLGSVAGTVARVIALAPGVAAQLAVAVDLRNLVVLGVAPAAGHRVAGLAGLPALSVALHTLGSAWLARSSRIPQYHLVRLLWEREGV